MRFVMVNDRTPFRRTFCVLCCEPISGGYLRDVTTRFCYCDADCYALHCAAAARLENRGPSIVNSPRCMDKDERNDSHEIHIGKS